mgnify:CR=1 FL=1
MELFTFSSIFFLILALVLKDFYFKIIILALSISSTIFHMLDHEINDDYFIIEYIRKIDISIIFLLAIYILTNNIFISAILFMLFTIIYSKYDISIIALFTYVIGLIKIIYVILKNENFNCAILLFSLIFIGIICLVNNNKIYKNIPYHVSWNRQNAFIWHFINCIVLYIGLSICKK